MNVRSVGKAPQVAEERPFIIWMMPESSTASMATRAPNKPALYKGANFLINLC